MATGEVDAFLAIWSKGFLEQEGTRPLLMPAAADSDRVLPVRLTPEPAARLRIGVMSVEIDTQHMIELR